MTELNRFDGISTWYDWLARAFSGNTILKSQLSLLERIPPRSRVLILGGGTGEILPYLFHEVKGIEVWFVDASSAMINRARSRVSSSDKIHFIHGTQNDIPSSATFDVVMTCFFLDLFGTCELKDVISKIQEHLGSRDKLLVADFVSETFWHRWLLKMLYGFFLLATRLKNTSLPDWENILVEEGFIPETEKRYYGGFVKSASYLRKQ